MIACGLEVSPGLGSVLAGSRVPDLSVETFVCGIVILESITLLRLVLCPTSDKC